MGWKDVSKTDYLSHTQINMYRRCPKQFEFRYVKGIKRAPTSALVLGSSVHRGIEHNYISKYKKKKAAPMDEVMDAYADLFDKSKGGADFEGKKPSTVKDVGYQMVQAHYTNLAPTVQPISLPEQEFNIRMPGVTKSIKGFMDVRAITKAGKTIIDNKTAGRKKSDIEVVTDDQLTMYAYAEKLITGEAPKAVAFDIMINSSGKVSTQRSVTRRGPARFKALEETVQQVESGMKAGIFPPTSNSMICSWCGYKDLCPVAK